MYSSVRHNTTFDLRLPCSDFVGYTRNKKQARKSAEEQFQANLSSSSSDGAFKFSVVATNRTLVITKIPEHGDLNNGRTVF